MCRVIYTAIYSPDTIDALDITQSVKENTTHSIPQDETNQDTFEHERIPDETESG